MTKQIIEAGTPIRLLDNSGLEEQGLEVGAVGIANQAVEIEGVSYVFFMPKSIIKSYVISADRVEIIDEADPEFAGLNAELMDIMEKGLEE